jgi:hypothetical protein
VIHLTHVKLIGDWKAWTREVELIQALVLLSAEMGRELCRNACR